MTDVTWSTPASDVAVMPLYFYSFAIASAKTIAYAPRLDQFTLAYNAHKAK